MTMDVVSARRGAVPGWLGRAVESGLLPLYAATLFLSALLVFSVQPMFAKMVLPRLGGSSGVWNTAMVFFQAALLAGYAYAHAAARLLAPRRQVLLHGAVLLVAFVALPVGMAAGWTAPGTHDPILWLLGLMAVSVGLPFFAIAATAPLMQRWFAYSDHSAAADPYFLYGASNLGSLLALLGYPVVMEPLLKLEGQSWVWTSGYALLLVMIAACGLPLWRHRGRAIADALPRHETRRTGPVAWSRRLHWLLLAFAPSSLLLGVTAHITADVAAAPLLWVIPLALYLLTFVFVFARRPILKHAWMVRIQPMLLVPFAIVLSFDISVWWFTLALHLTVFFVTTMVCHGELAKRRPEASHLTEFYLWMSLGGVMGGIVVAIVAPTLFDSVYEYPLALILACMLRPMLDTGGGRFAKWVDFALPVALFIAIAVPTMAIENGLPWANPLAAYFTYIAVGIFAFGSQNRPLRFGLGIAAIALALSAIHGSAESLARERSFYGIYKVSSKEAGQFTVLRHGTTLHGAQHTDPALRREPLTYFSREGPLGQMFAALEGTDRLWRVGAVGLGAGTAACYRQPGQTWTFYEIDPVVERLARDTRYFHYLSD
jgi:hypothetical protein